MTSRSVATLDVPQLGAQRPRSSSLPKFSTSAGQEAVDLAASAGLFLDDWQQWVLTQSLGERGDGRWSAFEVGLIVPRQNGKGSILEARELFGLVLAEEELIVHSAHLFKTSKEAFRRVLRLLESTEDLKRKIKRVSNTHGDESIELTNGCRLAFVARSKGGGRGLSGDCLILDEAFALTDDQIEALMPIMSARDNAQIWYTSSPPLDEVTGEVLFGVRARGESKSDDSLAWMDWGQLPGVDLDDPRVWAASNPALGTRITLEAVARERRSMKAEGFGRERLGIWPETAGDAIISPQLWQELATSDASRPENPVFMVDVSPDRATAAIVAVGRVGELLLVSVVDHRPGTDWIPDRLGQLKVRWPASVFVVDGKSPAATLLPALAEAGIEPAADREQLRHGELLVMDAYQAALAWGSFVDLVRQRQVAHLDEAPLNVALAGAKTRNLGDGSAWARRGGTDITPLVAATGATWVAATFEIGEREIVPSAFWI